MRLFSFAKQYDLPELASPGNEAYSYLHKHCGRGGSRSITMVMGHLDPAGETIENHVPYFPDRRGLEHLVQLYTLSWTRQTSKLPLPCDNAA